MKALSEAGVERESEKAEHLVEMQRPSGSSIRRLGGVWSEDRRLRRSTGTVGRLLVTISAPSDREREWALLRACARASECQAAAKHERMLRGRRSESK